MKTGYCAAAALFLMALGGPVRADHGHVRWGAAPRERHGHGGYERRMERGMPARAGCWIVVERPVFTPGYWRYWQHPCGSYHRRWVPAESRMAPQQVWVPARGPAWGPRY